MSYFEIPITGRLVDPFGAGISGASVFFTSKVTSRGNESVPKSADAYFVTDPSGYYAASVSSGWYKIDYQAPTWLEPQRLGVATVSGVDGMDLGTLISNSVPPPFELGQISDVIVSGRVNGSTIEWNATRAKWIAATHRSAGAVYQSITPVSSVGAGFSDLTSLTVAANTLPTNGDRLRVTSLFSATTGETRIRGYLGAALVYDVTSYNANALGRGASNLVAELIVTRTGAAGQYTYSRTTHDDYSPQPLNNAPAYTGTSLSLTSPQVLKFTASGAASNAVTQREVLVEYIPAP